MLNATARLLSEVANIVVGDGRLDGGEIAIASGPPSRHDNGFALIGLGASSHHHVGLVVSKATIACLFL